MKASIDFIKKNFDWEEIDSIIDKAISEFVTP